MLTHSKLVFIGVLALLVAACGGGGSSSGSGGGPAPTKFAGQYQGTTLVSVSDGFDTVSQRIGTTMEIRENSRVFVTMDVDTSGVVCPAETPSYIVGNKIHIRNSAECSSPQGVCKISLKGSITVDHTSAIGVITGNVSCPQGKADIRYDIGLRKR